MELDCNKLAPFKPHLAGIGTLQFPIELVGINPMVHVICLRRSINKTIQLRYNLFSGILFRYLLAIENARF